MASNRNHYELRYVDRYRSPTMRFRVVDRRTLEVLTRLLNEQTLVIEAKFDAELRRTRNELMHFHGRILGGSGVVQSPDEPRRTTLMRPPGAGMLWLAELLVSRRTYERVFEPLVNDFRLEYFEALSQQRPGKARLIAARYCVAFVWTFVAGPLLAAIEKIRTISR